jgi:hypothetical protein
MVEARFWPVYAFGTGKRGHASLLVPALLHRSLLHVSRARRDLLLSAVMGLRRAGIESPVQQADLLQLPGDLTNFLNSQAAQIAPDDEEPPDRHVSWVLQCVTTGRVWSRAPETLTRTEVRYDRRGLPSRLELGTVGARKDERVLTLAPTGSEPRRPSARQIVDALNGVEARYEGAAIVDERTPAWVRVRVAVDAANRPVVLDPFDDRVDATLTDRVRGSAVTDEELARWIAAPSSEVEVVERGLEADYQAFSSAALSARGRRLQDELTLRDLRRAGATLLEAITDTITPAGASQPRGASGFAETMSPETLARLLPAFTPPSFVELVRRARTRMVLDVARVGVLSAAAGDRSTGEEIFGRLAWVCEVLSFDGDQLQNSRTVDELDAVVRRLVREMEQLMSLVRDEGVRRG